MYAQRERESNLNSISQDAEDTKYRYPNAIRDLAIHCLLKGPDRLAKQDTLY